MTKSDLIPRVAVFEGKQIRKIMHLDEWWFSIIDIVEVPPAATCQSDIGVISGVNWCMLIYCIFLPWDCTYWDICQKT